jgi:hypothetical protein
MSFTIPTPLMPAPGTVRSPAAEKKGAIPLHIYAVSLAALLTMVGVLWDISWHRTIGRDKFLSPPHILIYLGAIFAGLFSGIQVLYNSFFRKQVSQATAIRVWGIFYSSLGGLFCIWGAIAMLTSAPFDDWWHSAYGLDVKILSPPHTLLAMGMIFLQFGACVSICKYLNTGVGNRAILQTLFVIGASSLLCMVYTLFTDFLQIHAERSGSFYIIGAVVSLMLLPAFGVALQMRWGMTAVAAGYFCLVAFSNWILQLFPAEPKLGPILTHLTHFQPAHFPALIFVPALAMDWVLRRLQSNFRQAQSNVRHLRSNDWVKAFWLSLLFVGLLAAIQYPLSGFLLESPGARNWFFGADSWFYAGAPDAPFRYRFRPDDIAPLPKFFGGLFVAVVLGGLCARISLRWGQWMLKIQR